MIHELLKAQTVAYLQSYGLDLSKHDIWLSVNGGTVTAEWYWNGRIKLRIKPDGRCEADLGQWPQKRAAYPDLFAMVTWLKTEVNL